MAKSSALEQAEKAFRARKFEKVLSLLEPLVIEYRDSFKFYYMLGVSCMYLNDLGGAESYLSRARRIKINNPELILAQGSLFLRRGEISRAVEYYLEVLEYSPNNRTAQKALQFIQNTPGNEKIQEMAAKGKLKRFYPKTGLHPAVIPCCLVLLVLGAGAVYFSINYKTILGINGARADLSSFVLSVDEKSHPLETDLSKGNYRYILTSTEVAKYYADAQSYYQKGKDNKVQICINRILNSNASTAIKYKAKLLAEYLDEPGFDTLTDSVSYEEAAKDIYLYTDCWVIWGGRITNEEITESSYFCDLLVDYEDMKQLTGIVPLEIKQPVTIDPTMPIKVLGQITVKDGKLALNVKSIYQPLQENK